MKKKLKISMFALSTILLTSCSTSKKSIIPLTNTIEVNDAYTLIWNGTSEAYRYVGGAWVRAEDYDYQFNVIQNRYDNQWKSIKTIHRVNPKYDGKAGERDQTMYFEVDYKNLKDDKVLSVISSSLGNGVGTTDKEFRNSQMTLYLNKSGLFMPYTKFKISQKYNYEAGLLIETVELIKEIDGKDVPFMKNEEKAAIYLKGKLNEAPTTFKTR